MSERLLEREQFFPHPIEDVFEPFSRAENLQALTPPWLRFRIITASWGQTPFKGV